MIKLPFLTNYYKCIVLDPPWDSERDKNCRGFKGVKNYQIHPKYPLMTLAEITNMGPEVNRISQSNALLWLWTTELFLTDAECIMEEWGFPLKRRFIWVKTTCGLSKHLKGLAGFSKQRIQEALEVMQALGYPGKPYSRTGYWSKVGVEYLLLGNNKSFRPLNAKSEYQVIFAPAPKDVVEIHSAKPEEAFEMIRRNAPGPRVSLFERGLREGFRVFGNQLDK